MRPDPDGTPYDLADETVASVTDEESNIVVITEEGDIDRPHPNNPEGLDVRMYEDRTGNTVEHLVELGAGYWDIEEQDLCHVVAVEQRVRYDKKGDEMGRGGLYLTLKYHKCDTSGMSGTIRRPNYDLSEKYGTGGTVRIRVDDFFDVSASGSHSTLRKYANNDDKSLSDLLFIRQRRFADPSELPP